MGVLVLIKPCVSFPGVDHTRHDQGHSQFYQIMFCPTLLSVQTFCIILKRIRIGKLV